MDLLILICGVAPDGKPVINAKTPAIKLKDVKGLTKDEVTAIAAKLLAGYMGLNCEQVLKGGG